MANIGEKTIAILAENLSSGLSYLIITVNHQDFFSQNAILFTFINMYVLWEVFW